MDRQYRQSPIFVCLHFRFKVASYRHLPMFRFRGNGSKDRNSPSCKLPEHVRRTDPGQVPKAGLIRYGFFGYGVRRKIRRLEKPSKTSGSHRYDMPPVEKV